MYLLDAFLSPWGVSKVGYTIDFETAVITNPIFNPGKVIDDPSTESLFLSSGELTTVSAEQDHETHIGVHVQYCNSPISTPRFKKS